MHHALKPVSATSIIVVTYLNAANFLVIGLVSFLVKKNRLFVADRKTQRPCCSLARSLTCAPPLIFSLLLHRVEKFTDPAARVRARSRVRVSRSFHFCCTGSKNLPTLLLACALAHVRA